MNAAFCLEPLLLKLEVFLAGPELGRSGAQVSRVGSASAAVEDVLPRGSSLRWVAAVLEPQLDDSDSDDPELYDPFVCGTLLSAITLLHELSYLFDMQCFLNSDKQLSSNI
jgi:hypothetical protein